MKKQMTNMIRHRGTVMVLVVVVLVLLTMLGAAYLQVTRVQRVSNVAPVDNIDLILDSVVAEIKRQLKRDVMDDAGNFFATGIEPYDHSWQNYSSTFSYDDPITGTTYNNVYQIDDNNADPWLGDLTPVDNANLPDPTGTFFRRLSVLTPVYYYSSGADPTDFDTGNAVAVPIDAEALDRTIAMNNTHLVDASGNGMNDSRWHRASTPLMTGVQYFMAVAIEDLSAKVNATVAMSQIDSLGNYDADTTINSPAAPRWWSPCELDLGTFVRVVSGGTAMTELNAVLEYRLGTTGTFLPTPFSSTPNGRQHYWLNGALLYKNPTSPYLLFDYTDELALLKWGGIKIDATPEGQLEPLMPTFLRTSASETTWSDSGYVSEAAYILNNPRANMTVVSGAATWTQPVATTNGARTPKVDLNRAGGDPSVPANVVLTGQATADAIYDVVQNAATPMTPPAWNWPASLASDDAKRRAWADQFAACISDYCAADTNLVTVVNGRAGLKPLPFITEVYAEQKYVVTTAVPAASGNADSWDVTWTRDPDPAQADSDVRFAIEIVNPFDRPVLLENVFIKIGSATAIQLSDLTGVPVSGQLAANERMLLYYRLDVSSYAADYLIDLTGAGGLSGYDSDNDWGSAWDGTVEVGLYACPIESPGTPLAYPYCKYVSGSMEVADTYTVNDYSSVPDPTGVVGYKQRGIIGNGNSLNIITVRQSELTVRENYTPGANGADPATADEKPQTQNTGSYTSGPQFGAVNKTSGVANKIASLTADQILFTEEGQIVKVGEIANVAILGFSADWTVGETWPTGATAISETRLDFASAEMVGAGNRDVPHAMFIVDRLTTMAPDKDGADNDNSGSTDDADELFIPGRININTATREMLERILPIADSTIRSAVVDAIIDYRDEPQAPTATARANGLRPNLPGVAYTGEIFDMQALIDAFTTATYGTYTGDVQATLAPAPVVRVDFNNPSAAATDGIANDREEQMMIARWLSQVCTTRSDTYAAHILVKGYDFTKPVGERFVESGRIVVIFNRSNLKTATDEVEVVAAYRY